MSRCTRPTARFRSVAATRRKSCATQLQIYGHKIFIEGVSISGRHTLTRIRPSHSSMTAMHSLIRGGGALMRLGVAVAVACLSAIGLSVADDVKASIRKPTNIPAEALGPALQTLAKERGFQVAYVSDEVDSRRTQGAVGDLTTNEDLTQLLSGTGLTYRYFGDRAVSIIPIGSVDASGGASTQAQVEGSGGASSSDEEGKKTSSAGFRVAQVDQGKAGSDSSVEKQDKAQPSKKKPIQLEEVVVTGSRIPRVAGEGAQEVLIYTKEQVRQSGQTTVADFLNTIPSVSVAVTEGGYANFGANTTVRLRGLPFGTTLVLIIVRRITPSGAQRHGDL